MTDKDARSSSGTTAIVIVVAVLILGIPCIAGVLAVFGVGFFFVRSSAPPAIQPPQIMSQPAEPVEAMPPPAESGSESSAPMPAAGVAPGESAAPAPADGQ